MDWGQFRAVLWLRRRLSRNQFARSGILGKIYAVAVPIVAVLVATVTFTGGLVGGWAGLGDTTPKSISLVWLGITIGFLFFWTVGLLSEIQRSEAVDLQRLIHLPVRLGQAFVINFIASHAVFSIVAFVPAMIGLALGLAFARGPTFLLLVPLALAMVFMVSSWTYCLRGWLAALMANPRKRRAVVAGVTLVLILVCQAPNIASNVARGVRREDGGRRHAWSGRHLLATAQRCVPPLWVPLGAKGLAEHRAWPALLGTLGCLAIAALGLRRAYRITVVAYRGGAGTPTTGRAPRVQPSVDAAKRGSPRKTRRTVHATFIERDIPGVPSEAAALALATLRSFLRAPEVKMALVSSFLLPLIIGGSLLIGSPGSTPGWLKSFYGTGAVLFSILMTMQFLANQFGYDRDGFRTLVLSPADRRHILLGKNLATMPICGSVGLLFVTVAGVALRMPAFAFAAAMFQLVAALTLANIIGSLLSMYVPYKVRSGSMQASKPGGKTMLLLMVCQMLLPVLMAPLLLPPLAAALFSKFGVPGGQALNLVLSIAMAAGLIFLYRSLLDPLGRLLRRRETAILQAVTAEVE